MDKFLRSIDKQIESNKGKNLFIDEIESTLQFSNETLRAIADISTLSPDALSILINYATDKTLEEFCRINQYYAFSSQAKNELRSIYSELIQSIRNNQQVTDTISRDHYTNLKLWLHKYNPFAEELFAGANIDLDPVACNDYSSELQIDLLGLEIERITAPVLDIGCGKQGNLVKFLNELGIEAIGIDRFPFKTNNLLTCDWLEYDYGVAKWGTIISNLGFSNYFIHHNLRKDGNYLTYATKYMQILNSLIVGGRFHYAPDLPFIEAYLNPNHYKVENFRLQEFDFQATIVTRIKAPML